MYRAWSIIRGASAVAGFALLFLIVGTSDYHVMELGEREPAGLFLWGIVGVAMILPTLIHAIKEERKEWNDAEE